MPFIEIDNLRFTYPSRETPTLRGINATVASGDFVLLTGPTGCGKSTLLRTMNGLIPHSSAGTLSGSVRINGQNVAEQPLAVTCRQVGLLFQNPDEQLFCTRVEDEIAFGLENLGLPPQQITPCIDAALAQVGLHGFQKRRTSELSGGEKQRVALACCCAMQPQVMLLDEPTSHLDLRGTSDILDIVKQLNTDLRITTILATHRTAEVAPLCNRVWLMHKGELCLDKPKDEAFTEPEPYHRQGVQVPVGEPPWARCRSRGTPVGETSQSQEPHSPLLTLRNVSFRYPHTDAAALKPISYKVCRGEVVAIMGANGSGKTTLIHLMAGLLRPSEGELCIADKRMTRKKRPKLHQLAGKVGIVFQNPDLLLQAETVADEVAFGPKNLKLAREPLQTRVTNTLSRFDLDGLAAEAPYSLSRGQRQRVAVAANFSLYPELFLLDEPTTGQDAQHLHQLMDELRAEIKRENRSLIFATHDAQLTLTYADRVLLLREGELVFDGHPEVAFASGELLSQLNLCSSGSPKPIRSRLGEALQQRDNLT